MHSKTKFTRKNLNIRVTKKGWWNNIQEKLIINTLRCKTWIFIMYKVLIITNKFNGKNKKKTVKMIETVVIKETVNIKKTVTIKETVISKIYAKYQNWSFLKYLNNAKLRYRDNIMRNITNDFIFSSITNKF